MNLRAYIPTLAAVLAVLAAAAPATADAARQTTKKAIWGPLEVNGRSAFPIYRDLGVGIYQMPLSWSAVAPTRPADPGNPADPAYQWPAEVGRAIRGARRNGIRVALMVQYAPGWANGGRDRRWAPKRARDFKLFAKAAARRYKRVRHWIIWGEPMRGDNFQPLAHERRGKRLTKRMRRGPRKYAHLLDAAYSGLKQVRRKNKVIGGNTFTTGDISPKNWVRYVKLRNGKSPRMDMWGHNPFGYRKPDLSDPPLGHGFVDFGTLDTLARWLDKHQRRGKRKKKLFLAEYTIPSDHSNYEFNFWATRKTQAQYARAALRITRRWRRIYTLGWFSLLDESHSGNGHGNEVHRGLMTHDGRKKRAYRAFKRN